MLVHFSFYYTSFLQQKKDKLAAADLSNIAWTEITGKIQAVTWLVYHIIQKTKKVSQYPVIRL